MDVLALVVRDAAVLAREGGLRRASAHRERRERGDQRQRLTARTPPASEQRVVDERCRHWRRTAVVDLMASKAQIARVPSAASPGSTASSVVSSVQAEAIAGRAWARRAPTTKAGILGRGGGRALAVRHARRDPHADLARVLGEVGGLHHVREAEGELHVGVVGCAGAPASTRARSEPTERSWVSPALIVRLGDSGTGRVAGRVRERRAVRAVGGRAGLEGGHERGIDRGRALGTDMIERC